MLLALALVVPACGDPSGYAAKVNAAEITQEDLDAELDAIVGNKKYLEDLEEAQVPVRGKGDGTFDATFVASVLTRQILLELVHQEIVERDIEITKFDRDQARPQVEQQVGGPEIFKAFPKEYRDHLVEKNAEVTAFQAAVGEVDISEAGVKKYYEEHRDELFAATCVRHILVEGRELADSIRAQIVGGGDFAALAKQHSTDSGSGERGGELGCLTADESATLVGEFREAMESLPVGELSQPLQTQFGFHLIEVTSRDVPPFDDELVPQVRGRLLEESQDAFVEEIAKMVKGARVKVNPRYGTFQTEPDPRVVPPDSEKLPTTTTTGLAPPLGFDPSQPLGEPPPPGAGTDGGQAPTPRAGDGGQQAP